MTQPRGREASAPGKTYLFMLKDMSFATALVVGCLSSQQAPDQILELPVGPYPGDLEHECSIVVEQVVHLAQELGVVLDADVLRHFKTRDGLEGALLGRDVSVVHAVDSTLGGGNAVLPETFVSEFGLFAGQGDYYVS